MYCQNTHIENLGVLLSLLPRCLGRFWARFPDYWLAMNISLPFSLSAEFSLSPPFPILELWLGSLRRARFFPSVARLMLLKYSSKTISWKPWDVIPRRLFNPLCTSNSAGTLTNYFCLKLTWAWTLNSVQSLSKSLALIFKSRLHFVLIPFRKELKYEWLAYRLVGN